MRVSCLMLVTLRDVPSEAEIPSHQLLIRGGFIKRVGSGIYAYMPLMWRVIQKITSIVQEEMDGSRALQTLLPQLHPADLWKRSGRWQGYTAGEGIMFNLKDRQGKEIGLGPTHEEIITSIIGETINSYKQLPICLYQIQTKFRDEIRPRFGLMRSREFIMKDAYSFHQNEKCLKSYYQIMDDCYTRIFERCGIKAVPVEADSGAIGGAASQEFMVTADAGEDLILISSDSKYAANEEKASSIPNEAILLSPQTPYILDTPDQETIEKLCSTHNFDKSQIVKTILLIAIKDNGEEKPVIASIRGDQEINETKLYNEVSNQIGKLIKLEIITSEKLLKQGLRKIPLGYIGPDLSDEVIVNAKSWDKKFIRITDLTSAKLDCFICGANEINKHKVFTSWDYLGGLPKEADIRKAKSGDKCLHDGSQLLKEKRAIEVGHIFQLGNKYSKALNTTFTNEKGLQETFSMGCYGIGVSRLAQAAIEQNHDEAGIIWPKSIAPFEAVVVIANIKESQQKELGEALYKLLKDQGIDVLLDDRDERAGVKFKDWDLIGIPWRVVSGREASSGKVELFKRETKGTKLIDISQAVQTISNEIFIKNS